MLDMHEWALAQSVVEAAKELSRKQGLAQPSRVTLKIGELQDIDLEAFSFALAEIKREAGLSSTEFSLETDEARLKCERCGHVWRYRESFERLSPEEREAIHFVPETIHIYVHCPACGSVDFRPLGGRGVTIARVE